jgi:hypothetical protein
MSGITGFDAHKNFAISNLTGGTAIGTTTTGTASVTAGHGSRFLGGSATISAASSVPDPNNSEVVTISVSGDTLTLLARAVDGTTARNLIVGDVVYQGPTAGTIRKIEDAINNAETLFYHTSSAFAVQTGTSYTLALSDGGKIVTASNTVANSVVVPTNAAVTFPIGVQILVVQGGSGSTTITTSGGTPTLQWYSPALSGAGSTASATLKGIHAGATLVKIATDTWRVLGNVT